MATHSSILAWRIPWTEEPGGLQSMGSQRIGHNWVTKHIHIPSLEKCLFRSFAHFIIFKDFFKMWTIFKVFYWICYSIASVFSFFTFWFFGHEAFGILGPWPVIEPTSPALEGEVLTTGLLGKSLLTLKWDCLSIVEF